MTSNLAIPTAPPRQRLLMIDVVRGMAITLVVLGHTNEGLLHRSWWGASRMGSWIDNCLYTFHMPSFFFIAGIFVLAGIERRGMAAYTVEKLRTILWPYVVWVWIAFLAGLAFQRYMAHEVPFKPFLIGFATGNMSWFLPAFFVSLMVAMLLRRLYMPLLLGLALVAQVFVPETGAAEIDLAIRYLPFLVLGMWVGRRVEKLAAVPSWLCAVLALLPATAIVFLNRENHFFERIRIFPVGVLGIVMLLLVAKALGAGRVARFFAWAGEASLGIFLISPYFQGLGREVLIEGLHTTEPWLQLLFPSLLALVIPALIYQYRDRLHMGWMFVFPARKTAPKEPLQAPVSTASI